MTRPVFLPVFAIVGVTAIAHAQTVPATSTTITRHAARGVDVVQETIPDSSPDGPLVITVFRADPRVRGVRVEAALGQDQVWNTDPTFGREIVSRIVSRHQALAGINAAFFPFAGNPLGLHIQNGDLVTEPLKERTAFYVLKNGQMGFAAFGYSGFWQTGDRFSTSIDGLNKRPAATGDETLLFTPIFGPRTLRASGRCEVILRGINSPLKPGQDYTGTVAAVGTDGNTPLDKNTVVLSCGGTKADLLRKTATVGQKVSFRLDVTPLNGATVNPADIAHAVTGGPRLLTGGKVTIRRREEGFGKDFSTTRHPRTAIGRTKDGVLLFITVNGRQKGFSRGVSLPELAAILLRYGATDALNLDGGGSSAAVVRGVVANSPSEGVERPIADALLLFADDLPSPPKSPPAPSLRAPTHPFVVGDTYAFGAASGLAESETAVWGATGGVGFVAQNGLFHANRPGKGTVFVSMGRGKQASVPVVVAGKDSGDAAGFAATLTWTPDPASPLTIATLAVKITNAEGDPLAAEPVALVVTGGTAISTSGLTDRRGEVRFTITWDANAPVKTVRVSSPQQRFRDAEAVYSPSSAAPK